MTIVAPATGRGAQDGSGGFFSTGQTGPAVTEPRIPVGPVPAGLGVAGDGLQAAIASAAMKSHTRRTGVERP